MAKIIANKCVALAALTTIVLASTLMITAIALPNKNSSSQTTQQASIGLYWDQNCRNAVTNVQWGKIEAGSSSSITIFVRNEGKTALKLSLATDNWNTQKAASIISLSWNREGQLLNQGESTVAVVTLTVAANTNGISDFGFDLSVRGSEVSKSSQK
ncbi:MAG: hypothetical protein NWE94_09305 [Candidatus Bathyarchaeota archaeon]|nr:hypothetical protein [Candidatus Bathyarchaeota archaeon]